MSLSTILWRVTTHISALWSIILLITSKMRSHHFCQRAVMRATSRALPLMLLATAATARRQPYAPTTVLLYPKILAMGDVNPSGPTFNADLYVSVRYNDTPPFIWCYEVESLDPKSFYVPAIEMTNAVGRLSTRLGLEMQGDPGDDASGNNTCSFLATARFSSTFNAEFDLRNFPFDSQTLSIGLQEWFVNSSLATLRVPPDAIASGILQPGVGLDGWTMTGTDVATDTVVYSFGTESISFSKITLSVSFKRDPTYYITRVVANVVMLVIMGIFVVCIHQTEADRLGFVQSSFIAVISWLFVLVNETPQVGYLTRLDSFLNTSFGALFAVFIYNAVHAGYYKTIDYWLGRIMDDSASPMPKAVSPFTEADQPRSHLKWLPTMSGTWHDLNPHRKLDVLFGFSVAIGYLVASAYILGRPV